MIFVIQLKRFFVKKKPFLSVSPVTPAPAATNAVAIHWHQKLDNRQHQVRKGQSIVKCVTLQSRLEILFCKNYVFF
jgi:hypothetical protein